MSILLNRAIETLDLQPGQTYRTAVNGHVVEVRMLETATPGAPAMTSADAVDAAMLQPWFEIPETPAARTITIKRGEPIFPVPIELDESDLAPE